MDNGELRCIAFGGLRVDDAIEDALLTVVGPGAIAAAVAAEKEANERRDQVREAFERDLEAARYAADRAFRQYDAADPANRLVAGELEARWNKALARVAEVEGKLAAHDAAKVTPVADPVSLATLAADLKSVWTAPSTDARLKKRIVRTVIHEVIADIDSEAAEIVLIVHWIGGVHTEMRLPRRRRGQRSSTSADVIAAVLRARAAHLATLELGQRSEVEIRRDLGAQVEADRWTKLDRALAHEAAQHDGVIDLRPDVHAQADAHARTALIGRMQKLERLGLAEALTPAQWRLSGDAEPIMRALGERNDIIKRIHRGLADQRIERSVADFALDGGDTTPPIIGRLVAPGLDDELKGTAYAIIDGVDGRAHHVRLADLDAASDAAPGSIVELRQFQDAVGRQRVALAVRSDLPIDAQIPAGGATWLDRQLVARESAAFSSGGFGREVRDAMDARVEHLVRQGLANRHGQRVIFARDLLDTLRRRELDAVAARISASTGLPYHPAREGEPVVGIYRQRFDLASGRFALIDDELGFSLVPWSTSLERHLSRQVSGIVQSNRIEWSLGRARGPTIG